MSPGVLRLGIVGCGAVTELCHLPALEGGDPFVLTALVDRAPANARRIAGQVAPAVPVVATDVDAVLDVIDAAIVATDPGSHADLTCRLARAGKHVLVEKPVAATPAECARIRAAGRAGGVVIVPAHVRRLYPAAAWVAQQLAGGGLGTIRRVRWQEGVRYAWPARGGFTFDRGGGVLADLGPHVLDLLAHWFGPLEPVALHDNGAGGVDSEVRLRLRARPAAADPVEIEVELSRLRDLDGTVTLEGSDGVLTIGTERAARYRCRDVDGRIPAAVDRHGLFHQQLVEFARAVRGERTAAATLADAEHGIDVLTRARALPRGRLARPWEPPARPAGSGTPVRRVAVTGANGFIGAHVVDRLLADGGTRVVALVRDPSHQARLAHLDPARLDVVAADVLGGRAALSDALRGCDAVVHSVYGNAGDTDRRWAVSVDGTAAVAAAAVAAGVRRLVNLSSLSVFDPRVDVVDEDSPLIAAGPDDRSYAQQKLAADHAAASAGAAGEVVNLAPTVVYGPAGPLWTTRALRTLALDNAALPSGPNGPCDVVAVHDVADAIAFLLEAPLPGPVCRLLVTGPERVTWGGFYDRYRDLLGLPHLDLPDSPSWAEHDRAYYAGSPPVDTARLAALGFRARIGLDEGMARVARWARWAGWA